MFKKVIIGILIAAAILAAATAVFHVIHHRLYCRYKNVPGKSHCAVCGHRRICQKYHNKQK